MSLHHCWPEYFCIARFNLCVILDNTLSQIFEKHPRGGGLGTYVGATRPALAPPSIRCCCRGPAVPGHRSCGQTRPTPPTPPTRSTLRHSTLRHAQTRRTRLNCPTTLRHRSDTGQTPPTPSTPVSIDTAPTPLRHCFDTPRHYSDTSDTSDTQTHQGSIYSRQKQALPHAPSRGLVARRTVTLELNLHECRRDL